MKFVQTSTSSASFCREARRLLGSQALEWFRVLRNDVVVTPTTIKGSIISFKRPRDWRSFVRLALVHWYLPESAFALVHLELEGSIKRFGPDKEIQAHCILKSEPECLIYLLESSGIYRTEREFFGDIMKPFDFSKYFFRVLKPQKPKQKVYRRGYNDQGSRRLPHEQHEAKFDYSFTEKMNEIEEERQATEDAKLFVEGFLQ